MSVGVVWVEQRQKNAFACVLINNRWWCVASYTQADCVWLFSFFSVSLSGVGKSSLLIRFSDNTFSGSYITTIGVDFKIRTVLINGERVKLQIWDVSWDNRNVLVQFLIRNFLPLLLDCRSGKIPNHNQYVSAGTVDSIWAR